MKTIKQLKSKVLFVVSLLSLSVVLVSWTVRDVDNRMMSNVCSIKGELDKEPSYTGGDEAMFKFIGENVKYPKKAIEKGVEGMAYIHFYVEPSGALSNISVKKSSGSDLLDEEATRVIGLMPNWLPGELDGDKVKAEMVLPIKFRL